MNSSRRSLAVLAAILLAPIAAAQTLTVPPGLLGPGSDIEITIDGGKPGGTAQVEINPFPGGKQLLNVPLDAQGHGSAKWRVPLCYWVEFKYGSERAYRFIE
jgi:hypothetical protein